MNMDTLVDVSRVHADDKKLSPNASIKMRHANQFVTLQSARLLLGDHRRRLRFGHIVFKQIAAATTLLTLVLCLCARTLQLLQGRWQQK